MAITHTINSAWASNTGTSISGAVSTSATDEVNLSLTMLAAQTDTVQAYAVPVLSVAPKSIFIMAAVDCVVKFYAGATLKTTLTLKANTPVVWVTGAGTAPIDVSADITQIKYTTGAGVTGQLECRILL